ncbi:MAG: cbb3-type cytochrome c oxidase N-terminal domain-containing protein [bacterium]|nr:cbb3-type cytochrome c oxidase N-terminal domain-containing protein [bacterium]
MTENLDKLLDHEYDGIRELDNDLPNWWLWLFYLTIAWGVIYFVYYHVIEVGYLQVDEYRQEMDPNYVRVSSENPKFVGLLAEYHSPLFDPSGDMTPRKAILAGPQEAFVEASRESDTVVYVALTDEASIAGGQGIYSKNCVSCHGALGEGGIGPNLTDQYWLHGADMTSIIKSIKYGYPAKGMISWRGFLKTDQVLQVGSYVMTLKGTNPPNGKAPQGELVEE